VHRRDFIRGAAAAPFCFGPDAWAAVSDESALLSPAFLPLILHVIGVGALILLEFSFRFFHALNE
jgi:hypothetical protein